MEKPAFGNFAIECLCHVQSTVTLCNRVVLSVLCHSICFRYFETGRYVGWFKQKCASILQNLLGVGGESLIAVPLYTEQDVKDFSDKKVSRTGNKQSEKILGPSEQSIVQYQCNRDQPNGNRTIQNLMGSAIECTRMLQSSHS